MTAKARGASASTAMCAPFTLKPVQPPPPHTHTQSLLTCSFCCAQFPNYTTSCRQHMAHVGRALIKMRLDAEKPREIPYAEKKRRMTEKVRDHMNEMCCAELPNGKEECAAKYCIIHVRRTMTQRATHIARKMTEANHPKAEEHFDVATQVGIDVVNPDLHPDPACRVTNHTTDLAKMECMGKSIMHHAAKQHGYDAETLQSKLDELNLNVGESLMAMAKTFGYAREGRGPVKSAFFERQAKDEATASTLMRESRKRMEAKQGRKLAEEARDEGFGGGHSLGQHALHAGALRRQLQNASGVMHRGMMAIDRAATRSNNVQSRGAAGNRARPPHPDDLDWHAAKSSVPNPLMTILAVSAEEGSVASRFGNGIVKLNALRDRVTGAMDTHRRRLERSGAHRSRRRMSEAQVAHADALYASLEADHLQNEHKRPQLPKEHALSWLHDLVDWPSAVEEGSRLLSVVRARHKMREGGAKHHDIVKQHPTGWSWLDDAAKSHPTILGDAARRVLYRKETGADPPWHHASLRHRVSRRLEDGDAARLARDAEAPPPRFGSVRRLGVAFLESTIAAPFAFYDTLLPSGARVEQSEVTFWEATLRYVISGTVGCYFVAPVNEPSKTQGEGGTEDGDALKIMRPSEEKLCFPAVRGCHQPTHLAPTLALTGCVLLCAVAVCDAHHGTLQAGDGHRRRGHLRAQLHGLLRGARERHAAGVRLPRVVGHRPARREPAAAQRAAAAQRRGGGRGAQRRQQWQRRRGERDERRPHLVLK